MPDYLYIIIISFLASLNVYSWKGVNRFLYTFPFFLALSVVVEYYTSFLALRNESNILPLNIFMIIEFGYLISFLISILQPYYNVRPFYIALGIYSTLSILNFFFLQGLHTWNTYNYIVGILFIIVFGLTYFYALFQYTTSMNLLQEPIFWIVTALLFFYISALPSFGVMNFFIETANKYQNTLMFVTDFMNDLLYILYTIAFLCKINIRKYFSPS
jgi:hypothetical protein